ncbi:L-threonylcarbamoyladenylate synthase [Endozoicomonas sp. SCSIO W0465]|uniref:L-threonylcarbamoyladenylate synthase n=1 Tax=Endozoicomonas sp. SCSIO W0465 TaxID=2918516 RepID=UPI002075AA94|nr:L-threonylcarbamoyladenylate synthase [Endozoicomonas sp. SCSIO W0465]USE36693.1 threonylcarbamoyl-AMP synthase [Endozoicomonas sp. SCSIO W0465]
MMDVNQAAKIISHGGVIAYPTEAVWGIGCDPWNRQAVYKVLEIKQRPVEKGVILIGASEDQFVPLLDPLSSEERARLKSTWPGPFTWLIPDPDGWTPDWIRGQFDTVAVRISAHPLVNALCEATGHPIVSTSANLAGKAPLLTFSSVKEAFGSQLDGIVPGETGGQKTPSKIQDLRSGELVRAG